MQIGNYEEGGKERHALDQFRSVHAHRCEQWLQQVREGRFTDPAQAQRGEGDTQLTGRKVGVQLAMDLAQNVPAPAVLVGNGFNLGRAQFDHGELCRNEKAVEQDQEQSKKNHAEIGEE